MLNKLIVGLFIITGTLHANPKSKTGGKWLKPESNYSAANSPHESWRQKIFGKNSSKAACAVISRGLKYNKVRDPNLIGFIKTIQSAVANKDHSKLVPLFHPRLKVKPTVVERMLISFSGTYGGNKFDVTPYRVWALNSPNGHATLTECTDDKLSLRSFYGYPLQMGILFQVTGTEEIGHSYIAAVPKKDKWYIGAWHKMQWTHNGRDPEWWVDQGLEEAKKDNKMAAYAKMDIAHKLMDGGAFVYYQLRKDAEATRDSYLKASDWKKYFDDLLPDEKIVHAGTALIEDGAGIILRYVVDHNLPSNKLRDKCRKIGIRIYRESWTKNMGGLKCSMVTKYEDPKREGSLGGNYFTAAELRKGNG